MGVGLAIASVATAAYGAYQSKKAAGEAKDQYKEAAADEAAAEAAVERSKKAQLKASGVGASSQLSNSRNVYSSLLGG